MKTFLFLNLLFFSLTLQAQSVDESEFEKWETTILQLEQRHQTEAALDDAIVFYGSSSIRLWDSIADDLAPWPIVQRGYGGARLTDVIHFAPRIIGPHIGHENPRRCRAIVVFVANDITGNPDADATSQQVVERFETLRNWIREQDQTVPLFWIEVTPTPARGTCGQKFDRRHPKFDC